MTQAMKNYCSMIHKELITHKEAEQLLDNLCKTYGTEAVAMWMVENDKEAIEWLEKEAA